MAIRGADHIVLSVTDIDRSLAFYHGLLGLKIEREAQFRAGSIGFVSVRVDDRFVIDLFPRKPEGTGTVNNMDHFCLVTDEEDLAPLRDTLEREGVPIVSDLKSRWGAQGTTMSIYVADPDGNKVEIRTYAPAAMAEGERLARLAASAAPSAR